MFGRQTNLPIDEDTRHLNQERLKEEAAIGIYALMEKYDVSRAEFANRIGRSRSFVTKILEGSHNFTLETLADVYAALGRAVHLWLALDFARVQLPRDAGPRFVLLDEPPIAEPEPTVSIRYYKRFCVTDRSSRDVESEKQCQVTVEAAWPK